MSDFSENIDLDVIASIEAERGVLGALLLDNAAFDRVSDRLKPEHFYTEGNRAIYAEVSRQIAAGKPCDVVTVAAAMGGQTTLAHLNDLAQYVPSASAIKRYADLVIERHKSRALKAVSAEIAELAQDHTRTIDDRVEAATGQLAKLLDEAPRDDWVGAYEGMAQHTAVLEDRASGKNLGMPTGLDDLDDVLSGGLRPGSLVIIGARPSMGKTALGMTIGLHAAQTYSVGMLSMEMSRSDVNDRLIAMLGRVSLSSVLRPNRTPQLDWSRVTDGIEAARVRAFQVSDQSGLNIIQVRNKARNLKRMHGLDVLVVDYIGLMSGLDSRAPRAYQLEEISRGLKSLAKEINICVLCLAQVNRKVEERTDSMPVLSDLRDSGAIEQDADIVLFVHRPIQAKPDMGDEWKHFARLSVAKNRQGPSGRIINLHYQGEQTGFFNWAGEAPVAHMARARSL